jgi:hypothetical protein
MKTDKNEAHFFITLPLKCVITNTSETKVQESNVSVARFCSLTIQSVSVIYTESLASCLVNDEVQGFQKEKAVV